VANKLDAVKRRADMLPWLKSMQERHAFAEFVPMSAKRRRRAAPVRHRREAPARAGLAVRRRRAHRPQRPLPGQRDRAREAVPPDRRRAALHVHRGDRQVRGRRQPAAHRATIVVERDAHKGMVIGEGGERLKRIGSEARQELEKLLDAKVFLELWVKVRSGWADDEAHLRSYGYE
jgi:GTP-binding protein Era